MFGFLKDKLKEWVGKAKEKLAPAANLESSETKVSETALTKKEKIKKPKKERKKKEAIKESSDLKKSERIIQIPEIPTKEQGTAIEIETEIEEGVPQEIIEEELEKKPEVKKEEEIVKRAQEEIKETQEIAEELEEGEITTQEAIEKIEAIEEKAAKSIQETKPKSFLKKLFGGKEANLESSGSKEPELAVPKESFLEKVRQTFVYKITQEDFDSLFEDLDTLLLENNVAFDVVEDIKSKLSKKLIGKEIKKDNLENEIKKELKNTLNEILIDPDDPIDAVKMKKEKPFVILFLGINGSGKTTNLAKMAYLLKQKGFSVALAAADTFRAASIEQIQEHAKKLNIPLIKHDYGADPSAVGFDAIKYAKSHHIDVVLIDTAGRMHTKTNLISEMEKICRITNPDLKIFVAESIAGNDATEQAKTFHEAIEIDGTILSKADVDEKGGTIISVSAITHKPIFYLGTGQNYKDLKLFNKEEYIESLGL